MVQLGVVVLGDSLDLLDTTWLLVMQADAVGLVTCHLLDLGVVRMHMLIELVLLVLVLHRLKKIW